MKSINLILFFILVVQTIPIRSQSNADYFPYKKGNYWEYYWEEIGYPDTIVSYSVFDSVDNQGRKITIFDSHFINPIKPPVMLPDSGIFIIDSNLNVFSQYGEGAFSCYQDYPLIYKLNGKQGDQWVMCSAGDSTYHVYSIARIREIYDDVILGVQTKVMLMNYYSTSDSTDTTGLSYGYDALAKGFGLLARGGGDAPASIYLKGTVIDGILYGDTTGQITNVIKEKNLPNEFTLFQNYPNPFNPNTTIEFQIPNFSFVSLNLYDILGRKVAKLVNEQKRAGNYTVQLNATNLTSGIYFYRLTAGNFSSVKKLIILK